MIEEKKEQVFICDFCNKRAEKPELPSGWNQYAIEFMGMGMGDNSTFTLFRHLCDKCTLVVK